jgi:salicylate hydroxylase
MHLLGGMRGARRAELHSVFIACLEKRETVALFTSKRLSHYIEGRDGVQLFFSDGTSAWCDILVGADGLHSAVRANLVKTLSVAQLSTPIFDRQLLDDAKEMIDYSSYKGLVWSGFYVYRAVALSDELDPKHRIFSARVIVRR